MTRQYYRACHGALVVFDLTLRDSFTKVNDYVNEFRLNNEVAEKSQQCIVLVGSKCDDVIN